MPKFEVKVSDRSSDWREATPGAPAAMQSQTDSTTGPEAVAGQLCIETGVEAQLCIPNVEAQLCIPGGVEATNCITVTDPS